MPPTNSNLKGELISALAQVKEEFKTALEKAFPGLPSSPLVGVSRFGDYQCNNALSLFKTCKGQLTDCKKPADVAEKIKECLSPEKFASIEVAPQGFITVTFKTEFLRDQVAKGILASTGIVCTAPESYGVIVDFSSPNIAKEMHVGHLRSTIHGEAISRILEFVGHKVARINHLGDWGTQFGMLITHLETAYPDYENNPPDLSDLNQFYKEAKVRFDNDPSFKEESRRMVVTLQSGDPKARRAWTTLVDTSLKEFQKIYDRLGVAKLEPRGESFYNDILPEVVKMIEARGFVTDSDGAKCVFTKSGRKAENDVPLMLVKSDGGYGYDSTDSATIYHRLIIDKKQWVIYVTDVGQAEHFYKIFDLAEMMGWHVPPETRLDHVGLGLVCGEDGKKFKTRAGDVVKLADLLDEAAERAKTEIESRRNEEDSSDHYLPIDEAAQRIGYAAVKYFDLKQVRTGNYKFSYEKMLDPKGNTAVYMLYAYARICAIFRKAGIQDPEQELDLSKLQIEEKPERDLCMILLRFPEILEAILDDFSCHRLCEYMYDLSQSFTEFYQKCRIVGHETQASRLALCLATQRMLALCFHLLGIEALPRI
eukprot:Blabericola_migrator_1__10741@NODE_614_length_7277_cov_53_523024_g447_i0_p2_GENE_NODE_614_length_7277_cov_53_523024_g447_i0NODE_614_length_7277_cov_53_523024_g447_i0_p2_ORF_typecomplete_len595_score91_87tRNAsynt_1d/PF00750_19/1_7e114DALR_1/PF05746_15/7_9e02DALR_1/PF05746_15/8_7e33Arg_tRNA_synt_N/PF03485_16/1_8e12tRNAsynt_1e/PF01406_19/0_0053tRNAsynt_1/PF00133_22/0_9tRNAsynt_1/PF00133_22/59YebG/PF07130_12/9_8e02YebG/PF07130_12/1_2e04YebG/PF07130_12/8_7e02YebG/PF07130_12/7_5e03YebG/PF07130_12/1_5_